MKAFGVRELRQDADELVRQAEAGEKIVITVAGRPAAVLGPAARAAWLTWDAISDIWRQPVDDGWARDGELIDQSVLAPPTCG